WSTIMITAALILALTCGPAISGDLTLVGVNYLKNVYPFKDAESRRHLASASNLTPIDRWDICGELHHTHLFSFQTVYGTISSVYEVIGITDEGTVLRLKERSDFNTLLQGEGIAPIDATRVAKISRLYFQVIGITAARKYGEDEGIKVIDSLDDI